MNRIWYTYRGKQHEIRTKDQRRLLWSFSQSSNILLEANHKRMNAGKTHESSNTSPWSVSNPPNICWIPEDFQEFQETLSATQWRCSWALIAQPRASKLRPSAQKTCRFESASILFDFVCLWDVYMMCYYALYIYCQHCFFSTSSTTSSPLPILCFLVFKLINYLNRFNMYD